MGSYSVGVPVQVFGSCARAADGESVLSYSYIFLIMQSLQAIDQFVRNADASAEVPELRNKQYIGYKLSYSEWDKIVVIHEALRVQYSVLLSH